jgi:hypothetical protein
MEEGKKIKAFIAKVLARIKSNYKMHNHFCTLYIIQPKKRQEKTPQKKLLETKTLVLKIKSKIKGNPLLKKDLANFALL